MSYNCVSTLRIIQELKKCQYFKRDLGLTISIEDKNGDRIMNQKDQFSFIYNTHYKTSIQRQGTIGDIVFYVDHHLNQPLILLYKGTEEIIEEFDPSLLASKGIEFYLGSLLKNLEEHCQAVLENQVKKSEVIKVNAGSAEALLKNPGAATFADIQAYLQKKSANRFNSGTAE